MKNKKNVKYKCKHRPLKITKIIFNGNLNDTLLYEKRLCQKESVWSSQIGVRETQIVIKREEKKKNIHKKGNKFNLILKLFTLVIDGLQNIKLQKKN